MMAVWDHFVLHHSSIQLLLQIRRRKSLHNLVPSGFATKFEDLDLHPCYIEKVWIQFPWQNRTNPSWHAGHLEHHLSTNPVYHQSFDPLFLLSALITSAKTLCYGLTSEPRVREINHILLLLLPANKRGIEQKSWDGRGNYRFVPCGNWWGKDCWGKRMQSKWHDSCSWRQCGLDLLLEILLDFFLSQSSLDRGFPLLQLMAEKQEKVSESGW